MANKANYIALGLFLGLFRLKKVLFAPSHGFRRDSFNYFRRTICSTKI